MNIDLTDYNHFKLAYEMTSWVEGDSPPNDLMAAMATIHAVADLTGIPNRLANHYV